MSMRGLHGNSQDIYKTLKKNKADNEPVQEQVRTFGDGGAANSLRNRGVDLPAGINAGGGAFESMMKRRNNQNADTTAVSEEVSIRKAQKVTVDMGKDSLDYYFDMIKESAEKGNSFQTIRALYGLYMKGDLPEYEITGINKAEIMEVVQDFMEVLDKVLE